MAIFLQLFGRGRTADGEGRKRSASGYTASVACICLRATLGAAIPAQAASEGLPAGAREVIASVNRAAKQMDYVALRADMIRDFTWSFGGDASADQAIDEWKKQPESMRRLARATQARCAYREDKHVECPANAGASFRAGFKVSEGRWKMVYFVGGD